MNIGTAVGIAREMGFLVSSKIEHGVFGDPPVMVYQIDRIGPPAMMQHWRRSPFNDMLVAGPAEAVIEWVDALLIAKNSPENFR